MKLGMIAVLAAAAFATNDDTARIAGAALRFAARSVGIGSTSSPAVVARRSRAAPTSARSDCTSHDALQPATHARARHVAYIPPGPSANDSILDALRAG